MYRLNNRISASQSNQAEPPKPILAAKRRRQLYPFLFSMGPVALCICGVFLIGLMAVLYLSQLGQAVSANQQLQDLHTEQATLQRQNQDLVNAIAQEQSPDYIATKAKALGLVQPDPKTVQVLIVKRLELIQENDPSIQP
ncbi:MAG: septum formation initiator family protein [Ktedonobacteraceae bacterium]